MVRESCFLDAPVALCRAFPANLGMTAEEHLIVRHLASWWDGKKPAYQATEDIENIIAESEEKKTFSFFFQEQFVRLVDASNGCQWDIELGNHLEARFSTSELLDWMDANR